MLRRTSANYDANAEPAARRSVSSSKSNPEEIEFSPLTSRERDLTSSRDRARGSRKQLLVVYERASRAETTTRGKGHTDDPLSQTDKKIRSQPTSPEQSFYIHVGLFFDLAVVCSPHARASLTLSSGVELLYMRNTCSQKVLLYCVLFWLNLK